ncbi:MAG: McrC family protein [Luteolibacter sp.]
MPANTFSREVTIREYDTLVRSSGSFSPNPCEISTGDWDWLQEQCLGKNEGPAFFLPVFRSGVHGLQARNYIGTVETPGGTRIEILPKLITDADTPEDSRKVVLKMLRRVLRLSTYSWEEGSLAVLKQPLHEFLIGLFLSEVERLVKRGLRSRYVLREDEQTFLRGRLRIDEQLHRRPGSRPRFDIEYHEFLSDRPENRLIHSAVLAVGRWTRSPENQRRARTLRFLLTDIPESENHRRNFQQWSRDRGLVDYRGLEPWCELILAGESPLFLRGAISGLSFLFPMEQLFERYVAAVLRRKLPSGCRLIEQPARHSLVTHMGANWFRLKPDLLLERSDGSCAAVLDTKWKRIDGSLDNGSDKYGLSQSDFYQMAVYGQKYLGGSGEMFLIYPRSPHFLRPLPPFDLSADLRLWVVPFDLESDALVLPFLLAEGSGYSGWMPDLCP